MAFLKDNRQHLTYSLIDRLEERSPVAVMLLDFGKAFNSSSLSLLILKVESMGVCGISQD